MDKRMQPYSELISKLADRDESVRDDALRLTLSLPLQDLEQILSSEFFNRNPYVWDIAGWAVFGLINSVSVAIWLGVSFESPFSFGKECFISALFAVVMYATLRMTRNFNVKGKAEANLISLSQKACCRVIANLQGVSRLGVILNVIESQYKSRNQNSVYQDRLAAVPEWQRIPLYVAIRRIALEAEVERGVSFTKSQLKVFFSIVRVALVNDEELAIGSMRVLAETGDKKTRSFFQDIINSEIHSHELRFEARAGLERLTQRLSDAKDGSRLLRAASAPVTAHDLLRPANSLKLETDSFNLVRPSAKEEAVQQLKAGE